MNCLMALLAGFTTLTTSSAVLQKLASARGLCKAPYG
jgi:hypothetical protein